VQFGYQEGFQVYLWQSLGTILMLLGVLVCIYYGAKLQWFMLAVAGGPTASLILNWLHEFGVARRWLFPSFSAFNWRLSRKILVTGLFFTWFQMAAFIGTGLDNLVSKYTLMYKLLTGLLITQIFTSALWPAYSEAIERGDIYWARKTFLRSMKIFSVLGFMTALVMGFGSQWILSVWVGDEMIPTFLMASGFALWSFITNFFAGISAVLSNSSAIKKLTLLTTFAALFSLLLKIIFAKYFGVDLVIWGTVIGYGIICIPGLILSRKNLE
jgi:O-antigen/teichoic acid export membrane protein